MHLRRQSALAAGLLALSLPLLSGCGMKYATERPYTPAAGVNERADTMNVLGAVIVASEPDAGTFVATLVNNSPSQALSLDELGPGTGGSLQADFGDSISVPSQKYVNLAEGSQGIDVTGTFGAGDFVPVSLTFSDGSSVSMDVPVVTNCGWYDGDYAAPAPIEPSGSAGSSGSASESASPSAEASSSAAIDQPGAISEDYTCDVGATPTAGAGE